MIAPARSVAQTLATATLALTLVACGGSSNSSPDPAPNDDTTDMDDSDSMPDDGPGEDTTDDDSDGRKPDDSTGDDTTDEEDDGSDVDNTDEDDEETTEFFGPRIELQGTINHVTDSRGRAYLFGTVKNTGTESAVFIKAYCDFYSADSALVKEQSTYIIGTNFTFTRSNTTTNTALKPGDEGVFNVTPFIDSTDFSTYECKYRFEDAVGTQEPAAKLELTGTVDVQEISLGYTGYDGQVKNTGDEGLIFGVMHFVTRDTTDSIIDITLKYIDGETVFLESIDSTTDTALNTGSTSAFSVWTTVPFPDYGQHSVYLSWQDSNIVNGVASKSAKHAENSLSAPSIEERDARIDRLREQVLQANQH